MKKVNEQSKRFPKHIRKVSMMLYKLLTLRTSIIQSPEGHRSSPAKDLKIVIRSVKVIRDVIKVMTITHGVMVMIAQPLYHTLMKFTRTSVTFSDKLLKYLYLKNKFIRQVKHPQSEVKARMH